MIPEAAVEAAIGAHGLDYGKALAWERKMIQTILEAAAPNLHNGRELRETKA